MRPRVGMTNAGGEGVCAASGVIVTGKSRFHARYGRASEWQRCWRRPKRAKSAKSNSVPNL